MPKWIKIHTTTINGDHIRELKPYVGSLISDLLETNTTRVTTGAKMGATITMSSPNYNEFSGSLNGIATPTLDPFLALRRIVSRKWPRTNGKPHQLGPP